MAAAIYNLDQSNMSGTAKLPQKIICAKQTFSYSVQAAVAVAAFDQTGPIIYGTTATILAAYAMVTGTIATGADRTITIDVKRSTAGGAFASVLSGTIGFTNGDTALVNKSGTISSPSLVATDILQITIAVAGSASNQAKGLSVTVVWAEDPS